MSPKEKPTFYLYSIGYSPDELTLGHVVFKDYANPTIARHIRIPKLSEEELSELADNSSISGAIETSSEKHLAFGFQVPIVGEASLQLSGSKSRMLTASKGRRVVLKDPEKFFNDRIVRDPTIRQKLALWCTVSTSEYVRMKFAFREPVIWLLTGFYEFENASMMSLRSSDPSINLGLDAGITTALSGVPVGGSIELGSSTSAKQDLQLEGARVWAAQWQKLEARYVMHRTGDTATPSAQIQLYPDPSYSKGALLGDQSEETDEKNAIEFVLGGPEGVADMDPVEEDEKYMKAFNTAEKRLSRGLD